jgi:hypothetical protein
MTIADRVPPRRRNGIARPGAPSILGEKFTELNMRATEARSNRTWREVEYHGGIREAESVSSGANKTF